MAEPGAETSEENQGTEESREAERKTSEKLSGRCICRRRRRRRRRRNMGRFNTYFPRVLKLVHPGLSLSHQAVCVLDSLVKDMFDRIMGEAVQLLRSSGRATLTSTEIETAVRLLMPRGIGKHAVSEATKALVLFTYRK